jgi:hypothetical protein
MRFCTVLVAFAQVAVILAAPLPDGEFNFHVLERIQSF